MSIALTFLAKIVINKSSRVLDTPITSLPPPQHRHRTALILQP